MAAIPRAQSSLVDRAGFPTREWYAYFQELRSAAGGDSGLQAAIDKILVRLASLEKSEMVDFSLLGLGSVVVLGTPQVGIVQLTLDGDADEPGTTYAYMTGQDGAKGWYLLADAFAVTPELTKAVATDTGVTTFGLAELPDSGEGAELVKVSRDGYGRVAGTSAAALDDLSDVDAATPSASDTLVWDASASHWSARQMGVPYFVPANTVYLVPENQQALFTLPIELGDGASIELDGALVEIA